MANLDHNDEPSMEDILASIRKIIADDDEGGGKAAASASAGFDDVADEEETASAEDIDAMFSDAASDIAPSGKDEDAADVFELTSDMAVDGDVVFAEDEDLEEVEAVADDDFDMASLGGMDEPGEDEADVEFVNNPPTEEITRTVAAAAAGAYINGAAPTATPSPASLLSNQAQASVASAFGNLAHTILSKDARTLEDLVKEMLRPMLKTWLDDNLPQMVERMVREEIERISRGGMR